MTIAEKYFEIPNGQIRNNLERLEELYAYWNSQINVISRKDFENFELHHLLHSLSIAKVIKFADGTKILDVGTGGGFPGIPLAIMFPNVEFLLNDSIGKKIKVVKEIAAQLCLNNVQVFNGRAENVRNRFDFVVSRAVTTLPKFATWVCDKISNNNQNSITNGILYLKGGDISGELSATKMRHRVYHLSDFFEEPFFETKKMVHLFGRQADEG